MVSFTLINHCSLDWNTQFRYILYGNICYMFCYEYYGIIKAQAAENNTPDLLWRNLTQWGRVSHICFSKFTTISFDNGLSPDRHQAIIWTKVREIFVKIFSFQEMHVKISSGKWRSLYLSLSVLNYGMRNLNANVRYFYRRYAHFATLVFTFINFGFDNSSFITSAERRRLCFNICFLFVFVAVVVVVVV